jgi:hypothetical protein
MLREMEEPLIMNEDDIMLIGGLNSFIFRIWV